MSGKLSGFKKLYIRARKEQIRGTDRSENFYVCSLQWLIRKKFEEVVRTVEISRTITRVISSLDRGYVVCATYMTYKEEI